MWKPSKYDTENMKSIYTLQLNRLQHKVQEKYASDISWKEREQRAESTKDIDYGCQFDEKGYCKGVRERHVQGYPEADSFKRGVMCCCSSCFYCSGYLDAIPKEALSFIKEQFLPGVGFWRPKIGCILPRKWRSDTCLKYNCSPNQDIYAEVTDILYGEEDI